MYRTPGGRIAFGLLDCQQKFNYGPTVVYVAPLQGRHGRWARSRRPLTSCSPTRSSAPSRPPPRTSSFAAIYEAKRPVPASRASTRSSPSPTSTDARTRPAWPRRSVTPAQDRIPDVGEKAPAVETDTKGSVKGNLDLLDTRSPKAPELSRVLFADVVGKKPVALLFSTPQLCQSRVCGPVTDEMLQVKAETGDG